MAAQLLASLPPAAYPLSMGLLTTSSIFFGNAGLSAIGPVPLIKGEIGPIKLDSKQKVRAWSLFFNRAATVIVGGTVLTASLHLSVPLLLTVSPVVKNLALISAASSVSIIPYTLVFLQSTNHSLLTLDKNYNGASGLGTATPALTVTQEREVDTLVRKWDALHKVRYVPYGVAWATGLGALIGVLAGW